jgi:Arc/MetJ-type ribon-helix-helix transcriptional regulator
MDGMKLSVSIPDQDGAFLDEYIRREGLPGRSSAVQEAVRALRMKDLEAQYEEADREWYESGEAEVWDVVVGDGITDENPA